MPSARRTLAILLVTALAAGACEAGPIVTGAPASGGSLPTASATPEPVEIPFARVAWPPTGSACDDPGYAGRLGRIEALDALTVRFRLCSPDGAFRARLAHPSLAVLDATTIDRIASDRDAGRTLAGTGPYRIESWSGDNVLLGLAAAPAADPTLLSTVVLGWDADAGRVPRPSWKRPWMASTPLAHGRPRP